MMPKKLKGRAKRSPTVLLPKRTKKKTVPRKPSPEPLMRKPPQPVPKRAPKSKQKVSRAMTEINTTPTPPKPASKATPKEVPGAGGKPIEEMTPAEHREYLIAEAQKNEDHEAEVLQKTIDSNAAHGAEPSVEFVQTDTANDDRRSKAMEQVDASLQNPHEKKAPAKKP